METSYTVSADLRYFDGGHFVLDEYADAIDEAIIETFSHSLTQIQPNERVPRAYVREFPHGERPCDSAAPGLRRALR